MGNGASEPAVNQHICMPPVISHLAHVPQVAMPKAKPKAKARSRPHSLSPPRVPVPVSPGVPGPAALQSHFLASQAFSVATQEPRADMLPRCQSLELPYGQPIVHELPIARE